MAIGKTLGLCFTQQRFCGIHLKMCLSIFELDIYLHGDSARDWVNALGTRNENPEGIWSKRSAPFSGCLG